MTPSPSLAGLVGDLEDRVEQLERDLDGAERLAASRLAKVLDLLDELARRDAADLVLRDSPALEAVVAEEQRVDPVADELAAYAVGFPRGTDGLPYITHTAADRDHAERVLSFARRGEPTYELYTVHGPLTVGATS